MNRQDLLDGLGLLERFDLLVGYVQELQLGERCIDQASLLFSGIGQRALVHAFQAIDGRHVFLLSRIELARVDVEERLALVYELARLVDVQFLDPALELGIDKGHRSLVVIHAPHGTNRLDQWATPDGGRADAHILGRNRIDTYEMPRT